MHFARLTLLLLAATAILPMCSSTLAKSDKKPDKKTKTKIKDKDKTVTISKGQFEDQPLGPCQMSVFDKDLINDNVKVTDILSNANEYKDKSEKRFDNKVLGYVTPWNNHGYDTAKWFNHKIEMVAPVWLQLLPKSFENRKDFSIGGLHDVDEGWIKDVQGEEKRTVILPRLLFDKWQREDWIAFINNRDAEQEDAVELISSTIADRDFGGLVLELWSQIGPHAPQQTMDFVIKLAEAMHDQDKILVLVIPPPINSDGQEGMFTGSHFKRLAGYVDYFSLMTYDYSNPQDPGANSPADWVTKCVKALASNDDDENRSKILIGLNFYGYAYSPQGSGPLKGNEFLEMLGKMPPDTELTWLPKIKEHKLEIDSSMGKMKVFYPSLKSIRDRLHIAQDMGTGVAIWEMGQGLDYFYDLL